MYRSLSAARLGIHVSLSAASDWAKHSGTRESTWNSIKKYLIHALVGNIAFD
jgi:hypothetical protein